MIMKFDDAEEKLIDRILAVIPGKPKAVVTVDPCNTILSFCDIKLDTGQRLLIKAGAVVHMTSTEFDILVLLAENPGRVFSRSQIYDYVWNEPSMGDDTIIMTHIRRIRVKIEEDPSHPVYIQTVRGVGYRFNNMLGSGR